MIILFTGHRNKMCSFDSLQTIKNDCPNATWLHGGAIGFDTQVEEFAKRNDIKTIVVRPFYLKYGKSAPLRRNDKMLEMCDFVVALYDGRKSGGTYYTITKAREMGKRVVFLPADIQPTMI